MRSDQQKWNSRYKENTGALTPSKIVKQYYKLLRPSGTALDLACGNGRNSLFLAQKGFEVDAVDISDVAITRLQKKHIPSIKASCTDLDTWIIPQNQYDLILNIRFLDRRLFSQIAAGLKPGGLLVFQSFIGKKETRYCLKKNELRHAFLSLDIIFYEEKPTEPGSRFEETVSLVASKKPDIV